jgi:hypothetical protein
VSVGDAAEVAEKLVQVWNDRDLDSFAALLHDDVEWYDPAMADPPARGRAAVRAFAEGVLKAFPDFRYEVQPPVCVAPDGSRCAVVWQISATHLGPLPPLGYSPTGRQAVINGVDVLDVQGGLVVRILTAFDPLPAAEQLLGLALRPVPGTWRGTLAVWLQRTLAFVARSRARRGRRTRSRS